MKTKISLILAAVLVPVAALNAESNYAPPYAFTTFAGQPSGAGSVDGTGATVRFDHPAGSAVDASGNIYVTDTNNNTVRKITSAGAVTTYAGSLSAPNGAAVDGDGNVYVADTATDTIKKIAPGGAVTTFAGTPGSPGSTNGAGTVAKFYLPFAVTAQVNSAGHLVYLFVADTYNHTIRKIAPDGSVSLFAGTALVSGSTDTSGGAPLFNSPTGLTVDGDGNVYVADTANNKIRKITAGGVVTTFATGFNGPASVVAQLDGSGHLVNLFVADTNNHTIRQVTTGGVVTTLAGSAGSAGSADGTGGAARFYSPAGVAVDSAGNVYVSDTTNDTIRKIASGGVVTTLAGAAVYQSADGMGSAARFTFPVGVATDGAGNIYVADSGNQTIRKITPAGAVTTLPASFSKPVGVAVDGPGNVYVADSTNNTVTKITTGGVVTTFAAGFNNPSSVVAQLDGSGNLVNLFVADTFNHTIRQVTAGGVVTTFAGSAGTPGSADGTGLAASFSYPVGVALDGSGNLYVADTGNNTVRKITPGAVVTTFAGMAGVAPGLTDGTGSAARFNSPRSVAVDATGNVFVADFGNFTIRKISPGGLVTTLAGSPGILGSIDDSGSAVRFDHPSGVTADAAGNVYVADTFNNTIRKGVVAHWLGHDFNGDAHPDILWENTTNGDRGIWTMNSTGTAYTGWVYLGQVPTDWHIAGTPDSNGDGHPDILWENTITGDRGIWIMNVADTAYIGWVYLGRVSTDWRIAGTPDSNGDGHPDILWENTVTGDRGIWIMNAAGTAYTDWVYLGRVSTDWRIASTADFNGDGHPDILWENTVTGDRGFWLMNGTAVGSWVHLADVATQWRIAAVADFNRDGQPDILWENTVTGDRGFWLMNGMVASSWVELGGVATEWRITP